MGKYLVVNAGSSSLKFSVYEMPEEKELINGYVEKIGLKDSFYTIKVEGNKLKKEREINTHADAVEVLKEELINHNIVKTLEEIEGVGHRVLHGGEIYSDSTLIDEKVLEDIKELTKLGPLHHPGEISGIEALKEALPNTPNVAVFDTAFHQTMPEENYMYPVPYEWYEKYSVRKYGFHGTSHKYITDTMKKKLNNENVNLIICHIGSGASISAIKNGKCFDTTMGITPLDGLMMGTRSGAIDASILEYVCKESNKTIEEITNDLNKKSGLLGISGHSDCRDVEDLVKEGNEKASLAMKMYNDRIAKYVVDYFIELEGKVDAIVFTAGVGENGMDVRKEVIERLRPLNILLDEEKNNNVASFKEIKEGIISNDNSKIDVYVMPTDEEIVIARDAYKISNN